MPGASSSSASSRGSPALSAQLSEDELAVDHQADRAKRGPPRFQNFSENDPLQRYANF